MIFDIKQQQDLHRKFRLVGVSRHVINSLGHITYSSTIQDISLLDVVLLEKLFNLIAPLNAKESFEDEIPPNIFLVSGMVGCIVLMKPRVNFLKKGDLELFSYLGCCFQKVIVTVAKSDFGSAVGV